MANGGWVVPAADWNGRGDKYLIVKVDHGAAVLRTPPGDVARIDPQDIPALIDMLEAARLLAYQDES